MNPHIEIKDERQGYKAAGCRIDKGHGEPRRRNQGYEHDGSKGKISRSAVGK